MIIYAMRFRWGELGKHCFFVHPRIPELINVQEKNGKAKAYQVRQFLQLVEQYDLELGD